MCGILGIGRLSSGGMYDYNVRAFHDMLLAGMVRGMDGTGILKIKNNLGSEYRKIRGNTIDLLRAKGIGTWLGKSSADSDLALIGHNRYATTVNTTNDNAHPFKRGHIHLVHNGTITNMDKVMPGETYDVDSDGLAHAIQKLGTREALLKAIGAMSIVFYDSKEKTLNFYRNTQRPMWIDWDKSGKELIFGSEENMVIWAGKRNTMSLVHPIELPTYTLRKWNLEDGSLMEDERIDPWLNRPTTTVWNGHDYWKQQSYAQGGDDDLSGVACDPDITMPRDIVSDVIEVDTVGVAKPILQSPVGRAGLYNLNSKMEHPDTMFGYRRNSKIQWVAIGIEKASTTQDQWRVLGAICDDTADAAMSKVEVRCYVKTESLAKSLMEAHIIDAQVRSMERPRMGLEGIAIIHVSTPVPQFGPTEKKEEVTAIVTTPIARIVTTIAAADIPTLVDEVRPAIQVETRAAIVEQPNGTMKIVDMKGSTYDPNQPPLPKKKKSSTEFASDAVKSFFKGLAETAPNHNPTKH